MTRFAAFGLLVFAAGAMLFTGVAAGGDGVSGVSDRQLQKRRALVERTVADLRAHTDVPATEDGVELLLWDYARSGDAKSLERAADFARRIAAAGGRLAAASALPCFEVAQAGGGTFADGDALLASTRALLAASPARATTDSYARLVQDFFARAAALGTDAAYQEAFIGAESLFQTRIKRAGNRLELLPGGSEATFTTLSDHLECLDVAVLSYEISGSSPALDAVSRLAHELLLNYWDDKGDRLTMLPRETVGLPASVVPILNARAAVSLWRAGRVTGEAMLLGRAQRVLDSILDDATKAPESMPAAAFAAAILSHPPVELALVGEAGDPLMIQLRRAAFEAFAPAKTIVTLDTAVGDPRLASGDFPAEEAPALFVRIGALRSEPLRDPAAVTAEVAALRKRAGDE